MNYKRYKEFRAEIDGLSKEVDAEEFFSTVESKLMDYLSKHPDADLSELRMIVHEIMAPRFAAFIDATFGQYDKIITVVNDLYSDLGPDLSREFSEVRAIEKVNMTYLGNYSQKDSELIVKRVQEGLVDKLTVKELTEKIKGVSDAVSSHARVIAQTQIKSYGRNLKYEKAQIGEVFYYRYADLSLLPNSHLFCIKEVGVAASGVSRHINEINRMSNDTGPMPVITYCGGWHCYHDWEPDPFYEEK